MSKYMAIVYVGGKAYLVDREAYFLLCDLQKPELHETDGIKVFEVTLDWLQRFGKKAIKLEDGSPINFVPKFKKDEEP